METFKVKINGVYISFPSFTMADGNVKDDVITGTRIVKPVYRDYRKKSQLRCINRVKLKSKITTLKKDSIVNTGIKKKCMSCGCPCWRSDVSYCWDCYKYQYFESK